MSVKPGTKFTNYKTGKVYVIQRDPTPEEIRERCERIQSRWSDEERERRCTVKQRPVEMRVHTTIENCPFDLS